MNGPMSDGERLRQVRLEGHDVKVQVTWTLTEGELAVLAAWGSDARLLSGREWSAEEDVLLAKLEAMR